MKWESTLLQKCSYKFEQVHYVSYRIYIYMVYILSNVWEKYRLHFNRTNVTSPSTIHVQDKSNSHVKTIRRILYITLTRYKSYKCVRIINVCTNLIKFNYDVLRDTYKSTVGMSEMCWIRWDELKYSRSMYKNKC